MTPSTGPESESLESALKSSLALLDNFLAILKHDEPPEPVNISTDAPEPLNVLHTAGTLLKAHTTRLSLLLINKPFTPSAIRKVISDVTSTCLPAMMSAVEICQPDLYGRLLRREVRLKVQKAFKEFRSLLLESHELLHSSRSTNSAHGKDILASTGVLFESCDSLISLKESGPVELIVQKAREHRALLEDAIAELKEWGEGEDENEDEDNEDGNESDSSLQKLLDGSGGLPKDNPELRESLDTSMKKLKLMSTLYQALIKRRFKIIDASSWGIRQSISGPSPVIACRVDIVMDLLQNIPGKVDELASAFYDLDNDEVMKLLSAICALGVNIIDLTSLNWDGKEDEFTTWSSKWLQAIK